MKSLKSLAVTLAAFSLLALTGCKNLTPQGAASLTTIAVYEFGKDDARLTKTMRELQPLACAVAKNPSSVVEDVIDEVQNANGLNADTEEILNVILTIYQVAIAPHGTNASTTHPYLEAVVCQGWDGGLKLLPGETPPGVASKSAPQKVVHGKWLRVKK